MQNLALPHLFILEAINLGKWTLIASLNTRKHPDLRLKEALSNNYSRLGWISEEKFALSTDGLLELSKAFEFKQIRWYFEAEEKGESNANDPTAEAMKSIIDLRSTLDEKGDFDG